MNNFALLTFTALLMSVSTVPDGFVKPTNRANEASYDKLINIATNDNNRYVPAKSGDFTYEELREQALLNCKNNQNPDPDLIDALIKIEKTFNPPNKMKGMLLAAACMESGYNPDAKGDRKFSKSKKKPMAIGILQQWRIYEKMYPGLDRKNPEDAATTWMKHIVKMIPRVKKQCRYKTDDRIWLAAWVTGIRYKKPGGRCAEKPLHYRLLKRWHRNILRDRKAANSCNDDGTCGC